MARERERERERERRKIFMKREPNERKKCTPINENLRFSRLYELGKYRIGKLLILAKFGFIISN